MLTRRTFLKGTASLAGAAALAPMPWAWGASNADTLNILCWEGYNTSTVLDPFRKAYNATVNAESASSDPAMINKLRAGGTKLWNLINVNQPWAQGILYPQHLITALPKDRFMPYFDNFLPQFKHYNLAFSPDGKDLLGMPQRFGPFSFVVNTKKISKETAEDQGWNLFLDPKMSKRYGVLTYDNWNLIHISLTAGLDPFKKMTSADLDKFKATASTIFKNSAMRIEDLVQLNQALVSGAIDAYFTGGTYTASQARMAGFMNIQGITPKSGPVDGKGGVVWAELTSTVNNPHESPLAQDFLSFVQKPEIAHLVAFAPGPHNTVAQMGDPACLKLFTKKELEAVQWDTLDWELEHCAQFAPVQSYNELMRLYTVARRNT
ncbi:MAG: twin-arginine translocation signal domain-containing protein [Nevskiaceae bacterium]|nr:MAG: twin-arginine translocation signal domain-containing protein [Nevskiaceae bacterium]TBR73259.1 MAG: twin-arginine translocation signal domain-containing protein [Nevskiaceae bacterium]